MPRQSNCSRLIALGCVALTLGLLPARAFAEPTARPTTLLESARAAARREAGAMKERRAAQDQSASSTDLRSGSFFKTKAGIATLVIFGGGVAYAVYSSRNDRIRSTGR
jgi:hypothetical protein